MTGDRRALAAGAAGVLALIVAAAVAVHGWSERRSLRAQLEARNAAAAQALAVVLAPAGSDVAALQRAAATQFDSGRYERIAVYGAGERPQFEFRRNAEAPSAMARWTLCRPLDAVDGVAALDGGGPPLRLQVRSAEPGTSEAFGADCRRSTGLLLVLAAAGLSLCAFAIRGRPRHAAAAGAGERQLADEALRELRAEAAAQAEQVAYLQRQAQLDPISGLPLRAHFIGELQQRLQQPGGPGGALLLLRLLRLDLLNQRLGHDGTDRVLGMVGDVLLTYVQRVPGTFCGRLNGSDFALCLPVPGVAQETAESLHAALAAIPAIGTGGTDAVIGGIDGLHAEDSSAALAAADAALARAEAGSGVAVEAPADLGADMVGSRAWRARIAEALERGRAQLFEQRVVDRRSRTLHLECALRVKLRPEGEFEDATRWLALARRSRLLPQVDLKAVDLTLAAIARDGEARAVQASWTSLATPGFVADVAALLAAAPVPAARLVIELVEAGREAPQVDLVRATATWREQGTRIAVEYASAAPQRLAELGGSEVAYVRVDASQLRGVAGDAAVRGYARSLVDLIHGLDTLALADGLDDARDLAAAWALGFDCASGPALELLQPISPV
ncbi:MAG: EAL domain-containing protein [Burkholderiales bacterium]|nr:EAL domain-containing protein [Burkholderiales bacterium]